MSNTRRLVELFKAIGGDPTSEIPDLSSVIVPTYNLDDLTGALPNRASARGITQQTPGTGVGLFSTVEICPNAGCWIRAFGNFAANTVVAIAPLATVPSITTPGIPQPFMYFAPEGALTQSISRGRADDFSLFTSAGIAQSPPAGVSLFQRFSAGASTAAIANGTFYVGSLTTLLFLKDCWLPPGITFQLQTTATNVAASWYLELEFPALTPGIYGTGP